MGGGGVFSAIEFSCSDRIVTPHSAGPIELLIAAEL